ncbi:MAG: TIGR00282 family metallophosphoesterase [Planctomycetota bacterium]|nr:MAG: TIGR00282 family metallophosphoesterase [Planctomycetota bacterium]
MELRILLIGDIVGKPGLRIVERAVPVLRERHALDLVVANAENVADGSGITPKLGQALLEAGVDLLTLGDHAFARREGHRFIAECRRIVRPANYPEAAVGRGWLVHDTESGFPVGLVQVQGRVFMARQADCPFAAVDRAIAALSARTPVILCDVHAEATSEKIALGWHLDGRVSVLFGTHTHVPTADARLLPQGTAYITDLGMTGPYASVLGRAVEPVLRHFRTGMPSPFKVATRDVRLAGALVRVDARSGRAHAIERLELRDEECAP